MKFVNGKSRILWALGLFALATLHQLAPSLAFDIPYFILLVTAMFVVAWPEIKPYIKYVKKIKIAGFEAETWDKINELNTLVDDSSRQLFEGDNFLKQPRRTDAKISDLEDKSKNSSGVSDYEHTGTHPQRLAIAPSDGPSAYHLHEQEFQAEIDDVLQQGTTNPTAALLSLTSRIESRLRAIMPDAVGEQRLSMLSLSQLLEPAEKYKLLDSKTANNLHAYISFKNLLIHDSLGQEVDNKILYALIDVGIKLLRTLDYYQQKTLGPSDKATAEWDEVFSHIPDGELEEDEAGSTLSDVAENPKYGNNESGIRNGLGDVDGVQKNAISTENKAHYDSLKRKNDTVILRKKPRLPEGIGEITDEIAREFVSTLNNKDHS